jgi:RNA polymerase sigma factor (sigma-70 family)
MDDEKEKLIVSNLWLVNKFAKAYINHGLELPDLIQEGRLGLIKAAEKYDPSLGYKFSIYASWWIKNSIDFAIMDKSLVIRIPRYLSRRFRKIIKTTDNLR